eukprot:6492638-Amphidinium_carterae.2
MSRPRLPVTILCVVAEERARMPCCLAAILNCTSIGFETFFLIPFARQVQDVFVPWRIGYACKPLVMAPLHKISPEAMMQSKIRMLLHPSCSKLGSGAWHLNEASYKRRSSSNRCCDSPLFFLTMTELDPKVIACNHHVPQSFQIC